MLNQPRYQGASILLARKNFGCGSSREHAPWALLDQGLSVVIAPSFADIFYNNCFQNGILPVVLKGDEVLSLLNEAAQTMGYTLTVDLGQQTVTTPRGTAYRFEIDPFRKHCLMEGLDEVGLTMARDAQISAYENEARATLPWLAASAASLARSSRTHSRAAGVVCDGALSLTLVSPSVTVAVVV